MRILLLTGKGGVGKTSLAAGTAALAAAEGHRTLVLSTDAAHSLADALGTEPGLIGPDPVEVAPCLHVQQVDAQLRFEQSWADIQRYLLSVLDVAGVDPVAAEELTVIPGAEEVLALLELRLHALSDEWDVIVVDCAPTAETLRLLALPEALGWYMSRVFPAQRRIVKALKPVLTRAAGAPMPGETVFDAIERLHVELDEVRALLTGPDSSVRLVLTPESVVLAEARRAYTMLSLYGYRVDGVIANRVFPADGATTGAPAGWRPRARCSPGPRSRSQTCRCGGRRTGPASPSASTCWPTSPARCTATATRSRWVATAARSGSPEAVRAPSSTSLCPGSIVPTSVSPGTATTSSCPWRRIVVFSRFLRGSRGCTSPAPGSRAASCR